jgi:hypothetical protein
MKRHYFHFGISNPFELLSLYSYLLDNLELVCFLLDLMFLEYYILIQKTGFLENRHPAL